MKHVSTTIQYCKRRGCMVLVYCFLDDAGKLVRHTRQPKTDEPRALWRANYKRRAEQRRAEV